MIYFCIEKKKFINYSDIKYVVDFLFSTLGYSFSLVDELDEEIKNSIIFFYGLTDPQYRKEKKRIIKHNLVFFIPADIDVLNVENYDSEYLKSITRTIKLSFEIPVISRNKFDYPVIIKTIDNCFYGKYNFDFIGNLFFLLVGNDLLNTENHDQHGRPLDSGDVLSDYSNIPILNHLLWFFESFLTESLVYNSDIVLMKKEFWPGSEKMAVLISHNIDKLQKWTIGRMIRTVLDSLILVVLFKFKNALRNIFGLLKFIVTNIEPYWNFSMLLDLASDFKVKTTYFFGTGSSTPFDVDYKLIDKDLKDEIKRIIEDGSEVALLASYQSAKRDLVSKEKEQLKNFSDINISGVRQTLFRYDHLKTVEFQDRAKFLYDSSVSLLEKNGYKCGIAFPYKKKYYDMVSNLYELPVTFSDEKLKLTKFSHVSFDQAKDIVKNLLSTIDDANGVVVFNFSISSFTDIDYIKKLYHYLLQLTKEPVFYKTSCEKMIKWWNKRNSVLVNYQKNKINLFFPENLDRISFTLYGKMKIKSITGGKSEIKDNTVVFSRIKAHTNVTINLVKDIQQYFDLDEI